MQGGSSPGGGRWREAQGQPPQLKRRASQEGLKAPAAVAQGAKRLRASNEGVPPASAQPRLSPPAARPAWSHFLSREHHLLVQRYIASVCASVREKTAPSGSISRASNFQLEAVPGAVDLLLDLVTTYIGTVWESCVELSKLRVDATPHTSMGDMIDEDFEASTKLERLRARDAAIASAQNKDGDGGDGTSGNERAAAGEERKSQQQQPQSATDRFLFGASGSSSSEEVFGGEDTATDMIELMARRKLMEESIVRRKQATLNRGVRVSDIYAVLQLTTTDDDGHPAPVITMPPRARAEFLASCNRYFVNFVDRVLTQLQYRAAAAAAAGKTPNQLGPNPGVGSTAPPQRPSR